MYPLSFGYDVWYQLSDRSERGGVHFAQDSEGWT